MKALVYAIVILAAASIGMSGDSTTEQADVLLKVLGLNQKRLPNQKKSPFSLPPGEPCITLHEELRRDLSVGLLGDTCIYSNRTVTARTLQSLQHPNTAAVLYVTTSLTSNESRQVWAIASNLVNTVKSDRFVGWSGPMYGISIRLAGGKRDVWMKCSHDVDIFERGELSEAAATLRLMVSNAFARTPEHKLGKILRTGTAEQDKSSVRGKPRR